MATHETQSRRIKVGLVQINNSFSGQHYFPYSVGILQAYAMEHLREPERYQFVLPVYRRISVEEAVEQFQLRRDPFLVFTNAGTDSVNVLYRRKGGGLGLIEPVP